MPLNLAGVDWLFFDLGYTLINEDAAAAERLRQISEALSECSVDASPEALRSELYAASARFDPNPFRSVLTAFTRSESVIEFVRQSGSYPKHLELPYSQAHRLLERLTVRYKLGVIANQPMGTAERLRGYGLADYFSVCVSSAEVGVSKPDAAIFRLALEQAMCAPQDAVMIGDRLDNDIAPAKAMGFGTVRILQGPGRTQQPRSIAETPDATAADLCDLMSILCGTTPDGSGVGVGGTDAHGG